MRGGLGTGDWGLGGTCYASSGAACPSRRAEIGGVAVRGCGREGPSATPILLPPILPPKPFPVVSRPWLGLLVVLALAVASPADAQTRRVEVLGGDVVEVTADSNGTVRRIVGNVRLRQDTTDFFADRAVIYDDRGEAVLDGRVRILSGQDTLTAATVSYDSNTKIASAEGEVRVGDGESVLFAPVLSFDRQAEVSTFEGGGRILHQGAVLTAPTGTYSSARRFARLDGPVRLEDSTGVLTAARGTYDARVRRADFAGDVRLRRPDARLDADSVVYFRRTERARAYREVVLERIGDGQEVEGRPVAPADSSRRTFLFGDQLLYDGQAETAAARGTPERDPLLLALSADSTGRVDTTLTRAPRIDAARLVAGVDTLQTITATGGARLWQRRLAAVADSARFVRQLDSSNVPLDQLGLFGASHPSVWADGSQLTGDSLLARARDGTLDSLRVLGTAFAARVDSTLGRLQQIAGRQMLGVFDGDELRHLSVWPNAQVIYYTATSDGLLENVLQLSQDSLSFHFRDGELRELFGGGVTDGGLIPPSQAPANPRLPGFAFRTEGAPTHNGLLDLDGWEAAWLEAHGPPPEWLIPPPAPAQAVDGVPPPESSTAILDGLP